MNYELIHSSSNDIERLIKYKKKTIYEICNKFYKFENHKLIENKVV